MTPLDQPELFCSLIGWPESELVWDDRAFEVHRIPREAVLAAPPAAEVDAALHAWLLDLGVDPKERRLQIPCGFSVGTFDMPFVEHALPRSYGLFSRRCADLNAILFALGAWREAERTLRELDEHALVRQKNARARRFASMKNKQNPDVDSSHVPPARTADDARKLHRRACSQVARSSSVSAGTTGLFSSPSHPSAVARGSLGRAVGAGAMPSTGGVHHPSH